MANLIITVIAIALVAVASLMGAYYGGSAFLNNQAAAGASTSLNQGQQLQGAWNAYLSDNLNSPPNNVSLLVNNGYLAQIPTSPAAAGGVAAKQISVGTATATIGGTSGTHYFAWADLGVPSGTPSASDANAAACDRVIKTALGGSGAYTGSGSMVVTGTPGTVFNGSTSGNGTFGCAYFTTAPSHSIGGGTIAVNHYVMEYLLQ